jgi:hypothetical protein
MALRFSLERWIDLRQEGWYSGDSRGHYLSPHAALLEGAAEDLAVVNLLALESDCDGHTNLANILAFSGQRPALEMPGHMVVVNTLNQHESLGHLGLLNCHRIVFPLRAGGGWGWHQWGLADWSHQCHRKGGLVVWCGHEAVPDLRAAEVDAFELRPGEQGGIDQEDLAQWYGVLDGGARIPIVGGSGKSTNTQALGMLRTYAHLGTQELSYKDWIEAIRAGKSFATTGPLLRFQVEGQEPETGVTLRAPTRVNVRAEAKSLVPFEKVQLIMNGQSIAVAEASGEPCAARLEADVDLTTNGWLAASCTKRGRSKREVSMAHSAPVYVN